VFTEFVARVGIPKRRFCDRAEIRRIIRRVFPNIQIEFEENSTTRLIGVEAPDQKSAAIVVPLLTKVVADLKR
jgi:hypothetical protein